MRFSMLLLLCSLLALLPTVTAKTKKALRVYGFDTKDCIGAPDGPNHDIGREQCVNFGAAVSIKVMPLHNDWLDPVNRGETKCWLIPFKAANCPYGQELDPLSVPEMMNRCFTPTDVAIDTIGSVKFACSYMAEHTTTWTEPLEITSWEFDGNGDFFKPHPTTVVQSYSLTYLVREEPLNSRRKKPLMPAVPPSFREEVDTPPTTNKRDGDSKYVWMFHPWSRTAVCYDCYTKSKKGDYSKFECRSGPHNIVNCGPMPQLNADAQPLTHTETVTQLTTTTSTIDTTVTTSLTGTPAHRLMKRALGSWHMRVKFENPWIPGNIMCADAEWEKRGQINSEIRLQKIGNDMKKCNKAKADSLDIPGPFTTRSVDVVTKTVFEFHTATITKAEAPTPSASSTSATQRAPFPPHGDL